MFLELIKAVAFLLALSMLQYFLIRLFRRRSQLFLNLMSGILFGSICVIGMTLPIELAPGVIFDPRSVILSMAGLFYGPVTAAIAMIIAGGYRAWLGGGGAFVGVTVVVASTALGLLYRYGWRKGRVKIDAPTLLVFGFVVHVVEVLLFTQLPDMAVSRVMGTLALPLILTFTPATAVLGLMLKDIEQRFKTEEDLRTSQARLSLYLEKTPLAAVTWDMDFRCLRWNRAAQKIFGYDAEEAVGQRATDLIVLPTEQSDAEHKFRMLLSGRGGERITQENITKDGRTITCDWYNTPITNERGEVIGVVSLAEDMTPLKKTTEELQFKNLLLITQQEASVDGILSVNAKGEVISLNQRFLDMWDLPTTFSASDDDEILLKSALEKVVDASGFLNRVKYLYEHRSATSEDEIALKSGVVLERRSAPMLGPAGEYFGRLWTFRDITSRKQSEELIWKQANFDGLTGLANRQMLRDRLEQEVRNAHRTGDKVALLYLDLDQFKDINDTLGHDVGDRLLVKVADRLARCVRESDTVARLGGDEFIVIMGGLRDLVGTERVANAVLRNLSEPYKLDEETLYMSASIGITYYPEDALNADDMLKNADHAMYAAKASGGGCYRFFTAYMQERAVKRMSMIKELRAALPPSEQLQLYYQPIVELATGNITKAEALLRWIHPEHGVVSPDEFIRLAEETQMIIEIGDWVFHTAARQSLLWRETYNPEFQISINTSPIQYRSEGFSVRAWTDHMKDMGLPGGSISVEITEGLLMDTTTKVTDELLEFRDAGVQVALDDFGTGYSSLAYLKKFDIDYLKIDRAFVKGLAVGSGDLALCEAIIVMAHKLGIKVIAEGVETAEQRNLLLSAGCDYAQGYFFSKPVPVELFDRNCLKLSDGTRG